MKHRGLKDHKSIRKYLKILNNRIGRQFYYPFVCHHDAEEMDKNLGYLLVETKFELQAHHDDIADRVRMLREVLGVHDKSLERLYGAQRKREQALENAKAIFLNEANKRLSQLEELAIEAEILISETVTKTDLNSFKERIAYFKEDFERIIEAIVEDGYQNRTTESFLDILWQQALFAGALQVLTDAIMASNDLTGEQKQAQVGIITQIGEEAVKPEPNKPLLKTLSNILLKTLQVVPDMARAVIAVEPILNQFHH